MIIHCLCCGKSTSDKMHRCPYCMAEVSEQTLRFNGLEVKESFMDRVSGLMFGFARE